MHSMYVAREPNQDTLVEQNSPSLCLVSTRNYVQQNPPAPLSGSESTAAMCPDGIDSAHPHHLPKTHLPGEIRRLPRAGAFRVATKGSHCGGGTCLGHGNQIGGDRRGVNTMGTGQLVLLLFGCSPVDIQDHTDVI